MFPTTGDATVSRKDGPPDMVARPSGKRRSVHLGIDVPLLIVTAILLIFGLLMVYSASWDYSFQLYGSATRIFSRQLLFMGLGITAAVVLTFLDYHFWRRLAVPAMGVTIVMLLGVLFVNEIRNGAVRTLWGGSIQPSELAKLVTVIYLSIWLYSKRENLGDISLGLIPLAGILGVVGGLIFIQPDLSAVITIFFLGGTLFFLAGGDLRQIGFLILVAILVGWLVVMLSSTGSDRVASYLAGVQDPRDASYHVQRSFEAFARGGWVGVGIGNAQTKLTGLPVPPTDSIFAVIGEETGILGAAALISLYAVIMWRGLTIARRSPDELGALLAAGMCIWLAVEAFINMAVMLNILPFAGNALPFVSAGGSNLVVSLAAIGILLNISRLSVRKQEDDWSLYRAFADLRRRDRRRRVSRSRRPAGTSKA
jgi:cell division protein FtsW